MNAQRLLVLQADDFGSSNAANRGVVRAFTQGCLTQSNLMAPCAWFGEAAKLAKEHGIPVGVHVTLTCEYPEYHFGPLTGAKALTRKGAPTAFPLATNDLPAEADDAVYEEVAAQIERVLAAGIKPTHLDAHMGAFPRWDGAFAKAALRIWERFRIPFLRLPEKAGLPAELAPLNAQGFKMGRGSLAERKPAFRAALRAAPPGVHYAITHAALLTPELQALALRPGFDTDRDEDLALLCDPEAKAWIEEAGFERVGYAQALERFGAA